MLYASKKKIGQVNLIFILSNVQNDPHGCLYIVVYVINIFEALSCRKIFLKNSKFLRGKFWRVRWMVDYGGTFIAKILF